MAVWGAIASVGDLFSRLGTQPKKNRFGRLFGATGEFSGFFWLIGTAFALRNFLILTTLGGFTRFVRENHDSLGFGGVWAVREIPGPNRGRPSWDFVRLR